jgi:hypothetical protein
MYFPYGKPPSMRNLTTWVYVLMLHMTTHIGPSPSSDPRTSLTREHVIASATEVAVVWMCTVRDGALASHPRISLEPLRLR